MYSHQFDTPLGTMLALADNIGLLRLDFLDCVAVPPVGTPAHGAVLTLLQRTEAQLSAYFVGALTQFDLPLAARGTPFQQRVWQVLQTVGWGQTESYRYLARQVECERGVRAVAQALARNPISIVVPCHRVIGSDGRLTGYAGGLARKEALLALEHPYTN